MAILVEVFFDKLTYCEFDHSTVVLMPVQMRVWYADGWANLYLLHQDTVIGEERLQSPSVSLC